MAESRELEAKGSRPGKQMGVLIWHGGCWEGLIKCVGRNALVAAAQIAVQFRTLSVGGSGRFKRTRDQRNQDRCNQNQLDYKLTHWKAPTKRHLAVSLVVPRVLQVSDDHGRHNHGDEGKPNQKVNHVNLILCRLTDEP